MQNEPRCHLAVLNLKIAQDKCSPLLRDPDKTEFKVEDVVLLENNVQMDAFNTKYKPSSRSYRISDQAFDAYNSIRKIRWVSIQHLQILHPTEHVLTHLPDMTSFGWMTK